MVEFKKTITNMTNAFGERYYRSDGKAFIKFRFFKSLRCKHTFEEFQYSTGGGCMADVLEGECCTKCGKTRNIKQVW